MQPADAIARNRALLVRFPAIASVTRWVAALRVVQMFRQDELLSLLTVLLSMSALFPMFFTPFLPLVDLGTHVGVVGVMNDLLGRQPLIAERFAFNWSLVPYWTGYVIMSALDFVLGPLLSAKATIGLVVLLLPISHMRLLVALGRSPRLGLWAFIFAWDVNLYWGWFTFQLGMAIALWAIAWMVEAKTLRDAVKTAALTVVIGLTHLHAVALVGVAGGVLGFLKLKPTRSVLLNALGLGGLAILLPWVLSRLFSNGHSAGQLGFQLAPVVEKVTSLYRFSLDTLPSAVTATLCGFLVVLFGPAALGALDHRETPERSGAQAVAIGLCCMALYFALPFSVSGPVEHFWTYPRYATYILLALLLLPTPSLEGRRLLLLAPGIAAALAINVERARQFSDFGDRTRPYLEIISAIRPHSKVLALDYASDWPGTREWPLGQLHGYAAAATSSFDPHLWDHDNLPIVYRPEGRPPHPDWYNMPGTFSMAAQGRFYDYVITHPRSAPQILGAELVREAGEWRLYAVRK